MWKIGNSFFCWSVCICKLNSRFYLLGVLERRMSEPPSNQWRVRRTVLLRVGKLGAQRFFHRFRPPGDRIQLEIRLLFMAPPFFTGAQRELLPRDIKKLLPVWQRSRHEFLCYLLELSSRWRGPAKQTPSRFVLHTPLWRRDTSRWRLYIREG